MAEPLLDTDLKQLTNAPMLTFRCNDSYFAVPIGSVKYITSDVENDLNLHSREKGQHRVIQYSGEAVQLVSFSEILHSTSLSEKVSELIHTLGLRRQDHIDWLDALGESIQHDIPFTKATDPHLCAFGKWYDAFETDDEMLADILKKFDAPHCHIHACAERLLKLSEENQKQEAIRLLEDEKLDSLKKLLLLFDEATQRLREMVRPVTVILEIDTSLFAIELDDLSDIVEFSPADLMQHDHAIDDFSKHSFTAAYLNKDNGPLYQLIDLPRLLVCAHDL